METLDKSPGRISRLFDQIAPRYDWINHFLSLGIDRTWRKRTATLLGNEFAPEAAIPGPVLDVCCGTADLSIALSRKLASSKNAEESELSNLSNLSELLAYNQEEANRQIRDRNIVVGIDFSPGMLELGRKKVQKLNANDKIVLCEGDALNLPFENDLFSVVSVAFGLRNVVDTDRGLAEMVRVAQPGGVVAILDFDLPRIPLISPLYRFYLQRVLPWIGHRFSKNKEGAYDYFVRSVIRFEKGAALIEKMQNAGLQNVRIKRMTLGVASLYWGRKSSASQNKNNGEHQNLEQLVDDCEKFLPDKVVKHIRELSDANEGKIAFQELCDYLYKFDVNISDEIFDEIQKTGVKLNLPKKEWMFLKWKAINYKINRILDYLSDKFENKGSVEFAREEVEHNEAKIALECLCGNILDDEIALPKKIFDDLREACVFFEVDEDYWIDLKIQ